MVHTEKRIINVINGNCPIISDNDRSAIPLTCLPPIYYLDGKILDPWRDADPGLAEAEDARERLAAFPGIVLEGRDPKCGPWAPLIRSSKSSRPS